MKAPALVLAFALILLTACGGGSKSEKLRFDVSKAEATAHNVLLETRDLPGPGWSITDEDPKENDDPFPESNACRDLNQFQKETKNLDTKSRVARAKREITKPSSTSPLPTEVTIEIEIYKESKPLPAHLDKARKLVSSGVYTKCLADLLGDVYKGAGLTATTNGVAATMTAPENGFALAAESQVTGVPSPLRFENYGWVIGNAKVTVAISGAKDAITADLVKAALEKTAAKLNQNSN